MFKQKPDTPWQRRGRIDSRKVLKYRVDTGLGGFGSSFNFRFVFFFLSVTITDNGKRLSKQSVGKIVATSLAHFHGDLIKETPRLQLVNAQRPGIDGALTRKYK